jgi:putative hydrolase of HD superfamily
MDSEELVKVCRLAASLKAVPRTGWLLATGVGEYESVADHSWGVGFVSLLLAHAEVDSGQKLDVGKMLKMALLHDLPEAVISDIPQTAADIAGETMYRAKHAAERSAFQHLFASSRTGRDLAALWEEYTACKTLEARIVAAADVIDMLIYSSILEDAGVSASLFDQFYVFADRKLAGLGIEAATEVYSILSATHMKRLR